MTKPRTDVPIDDVVRMYVDDEISTYAIADRFACSQHSVIKILRERGLLRKVGQFPNRKGIRLYNLPVPEIVRLYTHEMLSLTAIGERFGCSHYVISRRLKEVGVSIRDELSYHGGRPASKPTISDPEIVEMYTAMPDVLSSDIAKAGNCAKRAILDVLQRGSVPLKDAEPYRGYGRDCSRQTVWRERVFKRDGYRCQSCGSTKGGTLNAHHIENYSSNVLRREALGNGVTLCERCHVAFHSRYGRRKNNAEQLAQFMTAERVAA